MFAVRRVTEEVNFIRPGLPMSSVNHRRLRGNRSREVSLKS